MTVRSFKLIFGDSVILAGIIFIPVNESLLIVKCVLNDSLFSLSNLGKWGINIK